MQIINQPVRYGSGKRVGQLHARAGRERRARPTSESCGPHERVASGYKQRANWRREAYRAACTRPGSEGA